MCILYEDVKGACVLQGHVISSHTHPRVRRLGVRGALRVRPLPLRRIQPWSISAKNSPLRTPRTLPTPCRHLTRNLPAPYPQPTLQSPETATHFPLLPPCPPGNVGHTRSRRDQRKRCPPRPQNTHRPAEGSRGTLTNAGSSD